MAGIEPARRRLRGASGTLPVIPVDGVTLDFSQLPLQQGAPAGSR
jgi:hypothetical protein